MSFERRRYNIGVIGGGWVARTIWLPRMLATGRFQVTLVEDTEPKAVAALMETISADNKDLGAPLDVALVATPNSFHAEQAERLLKTGVNVIVDKPACLNLAELARLKKASVEGGGRLYVTNAASSRSDVACLREEIFSGRAGKVDLIELRWVRGAGIPRASWAMRKDLAGGGAGVDLGWHLLEVGLGLLKWPETLSALAVGTAAPFGTNSSADWHNTIEQSQVTASDVETSVVALVRTTGGGLTLRAAWASHENLDRTQIVAHGTLGTITLNTTFGFSPHRLDRPTLFAMRSGNYEELSLPAIRVGEEYDECVRRMICWLDGHAETRWDEMRAVVAALTAINSSIDG